MERKVEVTVALRLSGLHINASRATLVITNTVDNLTLMSEAEIDNVRCATDAAKRKKVLLMCGAKVPAAIEGKKAVATMKDMDHFRLPTQKLCTGTQ